ncbi:ATP-binding protein [Streptomyces sp. BI20]|uniref:ATP-binding protein n=1 Tax=Streptomyces sp. BI20 TaxID=3403460 RepID=UPI003C73509B
MSGCRWAGTLRRARLASRALGLRTKIAVLLAVGCSLVAVTIGLLIHEARGEQVARSARSGALDQLTRVRQVYELTGRLDPEKVGETDARLDAPELPKSLRNAALAGYRTTFLDLTGPSPAVWAARPVGSDRVLSVRRPLNAEARELADLDRQLVAYGAVVVALAAIGGALLANRLSRELRTAAEIARRISAGDLDARIGSRTEPAEAEGGDEDAAGPARARDEVAELSAAVDSMAGTLQRRIQAEQRFTADVAHELRTPLTGLQTAAELLPAGRPTELVRDRVAALRTLTEDLLEVARLDSDREEPVLAEHRIGPLVTAAVARSGVEAEVLGGAEDSAVVTDVRRFDRILANLLANAVRHGGAPITVSVSGRRVSVLDAGPGFPADLLEHGPRRFWTGTAARGQGTGLGLTIALGQAQVIGARVTFANSVAGGALAEVLLPTPAER